MLSLTQLPVDARASSNDASTLAPAPEESGVPTSSAEAAVEGLRVPASVTDFFTPSWPVCTALLEAATTSGRLPARVRTSTRGCGATAGQWGSRWDSRAMAAGCGPLCAIAETTRCVGHQMLDKMSWVDRWTRLIDAGSQNSVTCGRAATGHRRTPIRQMMPRKRKPDRSCMPWRRAPVNHHHACIPIYILAVFPRHNSTCAISFTHAHVAHASITY